MKTTLKYDTDKYQISQESWDANLTAKSESMMALGNGYLGVRSVDEEVESFNKEDFFINGIFNKEHLEEVSELANLADLIQTPIYLDGERFSLIKGDEYIKTLDIKTGSLLRVVKAKRGSKEFLLTFKRFVSQDNQHLYAQHISIKQVAGSETELVIYPRINGQTTNSGVQHFKEGDKKRPTQETVRYIETTTISKRTVVHNMVTKAKSGDEVLKGGNDNYLITMGRKQVGFKITAKLSEAKPFTLEKLMSANTSIENHEGLIKLENVIKKSDQLLSQLLELTFENAFKNSNIAWKEIWNQFFIEIRGESSDAKYDGMANAFGIFHMNSFVPKDNPNLSVGAKGLSGEGYQGHAFWDTEFFVVPNYLYTKPEIAKNLLTFRYKGIEGARAKAMEVKERPEESQLNGAQYPWEMANPYEGEVCPYWGQADVVTGHQEPIASRRQEIHVPADIAYAVNQYYDFTKDSKFMEEMGYEMIIDTAIFWSNRAEKKPNGSYAINDVMGPNEYKGNINNNAYINAFAKLNLELGLKYINELKSSELGKEILARVESKIPYKVDIEKIQDVHDNLLQQKPNENGIIAENDQFLGLDRIDVRPYQLLGDAGKKLFNTSEGHKRLCSQLVKQADVVLLTYLLPQLYSKDVIRKNFDFYEPVTTHDSSLSPTTYAIQAVDLRKMELAYKLYKYSLDIDLGTNMSSCNAGIHAGAQAAIWQSTIYGYGGLRWFDNKLHFTPKLPEQWDGLKYRINYQGIEVEVNIVDTSFTIRTLTEGKVLSVEIYGEEKEISNKELKVSVQ